MLQPPATTATILIIDDQEQPAPPGARVDRRRLSGVRAPPTPSRRSTSIGCSGGPRRARPAHADAGRHRRAGAAQRAHAEGTYVPVLVITGDLSPTTKQRALSAGAKDFLGKPFDPLEVVLRIKNLLEARSLYVELQRQNEVLEEGRAAPLRAGGRAARDSRAPGPDGGVPRRRHDAAHAAHRGDLGAHRRGARAARRPRQDAAARRRCTTSARSASPTTSC